MTSGMVAREHNIHLPAQVLLPGCQVVEGLPERGEVHNSTRGFAFGQPTNPRSSLRLSAFGATLIGGRSIAIRSTNPDSLLIASLSSSRFVSTSAIADVSASV